MAAAAAGGGPSCSAVHTSSYCAAGSWLVLSQWHRSTRNRFSWFCVHPCSPAIANSRRRCFAVIVVDSAAPWACASAAAVARAMASPDADADPGSCISPVAGFYVQRDRVRADLAFIQHPQPQIESVTRRFAFVSAFISASARKLPRSPPVNTAPVATSVRPLPFFAVAVTTNTSPSRLLVSAVIRSSIRRSRWCRPSARIAAACHPA